MHDIRQGTLDDIVMAIDIEQMDDKHDNSSVHYDAVYPRALSAYCYLFKPKLCGDKHATQVLTYDICEEAERLELPTNVAFILLTDPSDVLKIDFGSLDFIFVDIDHLGEMEIKIHEKILASSYDGVVFYDDVMLSNEMKQFWESIALPKVAPNWHFSGLGVVDYRRTGA
jgi:hypothetical protein